MWFNLIAVEQKTKYDPYGPYDFKGAIVEKYVGIECDGELFECTTEQNINILKGCVFAIVVITLNVL